MRAPETAHTPEDLPPSRPIARTPARARAARALHHQRGGAELHRQRAAGGRRGAVDDDSRRGDRAFVARADALLVNLGTFDPERRRLRSRSMRPPARAACPGCSIRCSSTARRRGRPSPGRWSPRRRRRCGSTPPSSPRCRGEQADDAALARYAHATTTVVGLTGENDFVRDATRLADHRQRPSADGAGHRHGLRRLGAGRAPASRSSPMPGAPPRRR